MLLEEDGIIRTYCHFGELEDEILMKRCSHISEHVDEAIHYFDSTVTRKLKDRNYRVVENGTHVPSRGLLNMLAPKNEAVGKKGVRIVKDTPKKVATQEPQQPEYRRLKYD
jgi:hypothetical protein